LLPFLFLPNLGLAHETPFGVLEISDYLIGPYLGLLLLTVRTHHRLMVHQLNVPMLLFLGWALASTLTINWRFGYTSDYFTEFGLLKIGKMALYVVAGYWTCLSLQNRAARDKYEWALLSAGAVASLGLIVSRGLGIGPPILQDPTAGYKASNATSVMAAILFCYIAGRWALRLGIPRWRTGARVVLPMMIVGMGVSDGRGGWLAAAVGIAYLAYRRGWRQEVALALVIVGVGAIGAYRFIPAFRADADRTFSPDPKYMQRYGVGVYGVDEGGRVSTWLAEAPKLIDHPVMGTGIYHRGGRTRLWNTGSHSFWLQMYLETGIVGGSLVLLIFGLMWRQTIRVSEFTSDTLAVHSALVVAFVGGLGGEYFYGGMVLFTLFAVYGFVGCQVRELVLLVSDDSYRCRATTESNTEGISVRTSQRSL
jgi:O-antigen ligase